MKGILRKQSEQLIHKEATSKHNEIDVAIVEYRLQLPDTLLLKDVLLTTREVEKMMRQSIGIEGISEGATLSFTIKAKTERSKLDSHDWKIADKVVLAKAHARACTVASEICTRIKKRIADCLTQIDKGIELLQFNRDREIKYLKDV